MDRPRVVDEHLASRFGIKAGERTRSWRVRATWKAPDDDPLGKTWESGCDVALPVGLSWQDAVDYLVETRFLDRSRFIALEVEELRADG